MSKRSGASRNQYQYRIVTDIDLGNFRTEGRNVDAWLARNWDKLTQLWYNHVASGNARFGYLLPKHLRLPSTPRVPRVPQIKQSNQSKQSNTHIVPLTPTARSAANVLRSMLEN